MKKTGILNSQLSGLLAKLGHTDAFAIADCGLPIPPGVEVVDLALVFGTPAFVPVLDALLSEVVVENSVIATQSASSPAGQWFADRASQLGRVHNVDHEYFKKRIAECKFVVRTGEATPYANIILHSGVPF
ncbi:D-ribose pyranase [Corynebacterium caspium]|uniref:D-ribose pyranase n=1 Tax=Corynebacterium caspium TaxID=234828 RepID=UPI00036313FE|nr:D-ribose pyranase [Corynebacterium caspium]WKD58947.1 D-ribose pyranase [Corynebacterium caspium DSM 44850]